MKKALLLSRLSPGGQGPISSLEFSFEEMYETFRPETARLLGPEAAPTASYGWQLQYPDGYPTTLIAMMLYKVVQADYEELLKKGLEDEAKRLQDYAATIWPLLTEEERAKLGGCPVGACPACRGDWALAQRMSDKKCFRLLDFRPDTLKYGGEGPLVGLVPAYVTSDMATFLARDEFEWATCAICGRVCDGLPLLSKAVVDALAPDYKLSPERSKDYWRDDALRPGLLTATSSRCASAEEAAVELIEFVSALRTVWEERIGAKRTGVTVVLFGGVKSWSGFDPARPGRSVEAWIDIGIFRGKHDPNTVPEKKA